MGRFELMNSAELKSFFSDFLEQRGVEVAVGDIEQYNFVEEGALDSFELLSMILQIESQFGVKVTPSELMDESNAQLGALINTILAK
jgi:acyl carrier protein